MRIPIRFEGWYAVMSSVLGLPPSGAYVDVEDGSVEARMGWAFSARFPLEAVTGASASDMRTFSRGVHGFAGRWLVNGAGRPIVSIRIDPPQPGRVMGFPIRLRELFVSVDEPAALIRALGKG
jgi:hypothetical protein